MGRKPEELSDHDENLSPEKEGREGGKEADRGGGFGRLT
jgi:hypothetical protein